MDSSYPLEIQLGFLKGNLAATDYEIMKWAEGCLTDTEVAPVKEQRRLWRAEINDIEALMAVTQPQQ